MSDPSAPCGCEESLRLERRLYIKRLEVIALKLRIRRDVVFPWSYIPGTRAKQHERRERWALRTIAVNALLEMARNT